MANSNILITGATGLLGTEIVAQLLTNPSLKIKALVRDNDNKLPNEVEQVFGDILDIHSLDSALLGVDYVIHAAAYISFNSRKRNQLFETNVEGTKNLINACLGIGIKKFVHISSVAAIGKPESVLDAENEVLVDENHKWQESPLNSNYGKSKYLSELEVWRGQAEGLPTVVINPSVILGEGDLNKSSSQLFKYVLKGNLFYTKGYLNYVDAKDVAKMTISLMTNKTENKRFIANSGKISFYHFFQKTAALLDTKAPSVLLGKRLINILWRFEYLRGLILGVEPLISKETSITARTNVFFSGQKAEQELGIKYIDLESSLRRITQYIKTIPKS
ncbi:MAG: dihydroflavonol-4-reductase [Algoriphagus sp.]|jgi:dihydroflavonol-4-reductase